MSSENQPKSRKARNVALVVIAAVILSSGLFAAIKILNSHPVATPFSHYIVKGLITINPGTFKVYPFTIPSTAHAISLDGNFAVTGDNGSRIRVYVMNDTNFINWQNGDNFTSHYSSGEATDGALLANPLPVKLTLSSLTILSLQLRKT